MKLFLLKHYASPSFGFVENRGWLMMALTLPVALMSAWAMPEWAPWVAALFATISASAIPQRPTAFEAALPISGRDIALLRFVSALAASLLPVVIVLLIVGARGEAPLTLVHGSQAVAIVVLGVLLPRLVQAREFAITPAASFPPLLLMGTAVVASINYLSDRTTLIWLCVATVIAAEVWWRVVPNSFQVAPVAVSSRTSQEARVVSSAHATWWKAVGRSLFSSTRIYIYATLVFGGVTGQWWLFMGAVLSVEDLWQRTRWMQSLPISRRKRFWFIFEPGAVLPMLMVVLGTQLHIPGMDYFQNLRRGAPSTYKQEPDSVYFASPTSVSMDFWKRAPNGVVPAIVAPWGETAEPYVIRALGITYYNPYSSRLTSSAQFADWQFKKLTTAVYGFPMALADYDEAAIQPRRVTSMPRMGVLNLASGLVLIMAFLFVMGWTRFHRLWAHTTLVSVCTTVVILVPIVGLLLVNSVFGLKQGAVDIVIPLFEGKLLQLSAALPSNIGVVIALAALPVLAMYALLEWQFNRSETVGGITKAGVT